MNAASIVIAFPARLRTEAGLSHNATLRRVRLAARARGCSVEQRAVIEQQAVNALATHLPTERTIAAARALASQLTDSSENPCT